MSEQHRHLARAQAQVHVAEHVAACVIRLRSARASYSSCLQLRVVQCCGAPLRSPPLRRPFQRPELRNRNRSHSSGSSRTGRRQPSRWPRRPVVAGVAAWRPCRRLLLLRPLKRSAASSARHDSTAGRAVRLAHRATTYGVCALTSRTARAPPRADGRGCSARCS